MSNDLVLPSSQVISVEVETQTNTAQLHCTSAMSDAAYYWAKDTSTVDKIGNTKDFYTNISVVSDIEVDSNGEYSICVISQLSEWSNYPVDIHVTVDGITGTQATTSPTKSPAVVPTSQPEETERPIVTLDPGNTEDPDSTNYVVPTKKPISGSTGSTVKKKMAAPKKVKGLSLKSRGKRKIQVKWSDDYQVDGFQIQFAYNRSFTKQKKNKNVSWQKNSVLLKNMKQKKTCYVRVRSYKYSNGKKVYGKWSTIKKCKIK